MLLPLISSAQVQPIGEEGDEMRIPDLYDVSPPVGDSVAVMFRALNDYYNWGIRTIGLDTIKELYTGKNIKICICDTGRPKHYAYQDQIIDSKNFTPDDSVDDLNQHSTHVGGIIHEIAPEAGLLFAKVLNDEGVGTNAYVANGIEWCALSGADAINLSLGGGHSVDPLPDYRSGYVRENIAASGGCRSSLADGVDRSGDPEYRYPPGAQPFAMILIRVGTSLPFNDHTFSPIGGDSGFRRGLQNPRRMSRMQLASLIRLQIIVANDDSYALAA